MATLKHASVVVEVASGNVLVNGLKFWDKYEKYDPNPFLFHSPKTDIEYVVHFFGDISDKTLSEARPQAKDWILEEEAAGRNEARR